MDLDPPGTLPCFAKHDDPSREESRHSSSLHYCSVPTPVSGPLHFPCSLNTISTLRRGENNSFLGVQYFRTFSHAFLIF